MPYPKTCPVCGDRFTCRDQRQIYCSSQCFHQQRSATLQAKVNHPIQTCPVCGQSFSDPKHPDRVYCSRDCMGMAKRNRITKICITCGKEFDVPVSLGHLVNCSEECRRSHQSKVCQVCGNEFTPKQSRFETAKYCSKACYQVAWVEHLRKRIGKHGPTEPERKAKAALDQLGIPYEPEKRIEKYLIDFYLPHFQIALEVDGDYWHSLPDVKKRDTHKTRILGKYGIQVIRITETEINQADSVAALIWHRLGFDWI